MSVKMSSVYCMHKSFQGHFHTHLKYNETTTPKLCCNSACSKQINIHKICLFESGGNVKAFNAQILSNFHTHIVFHTKIFVMVIGTAQKEMMKIWIVISYIALEFFTASYFQNVSIHLIFAMER